MTKETTKKFTDK